MHKTAQIRNTEGGPPPRSRLSGEARRQSILDCAAQTFAECGLEASTREVARRLGVTQALLYCYFPSKSELIEAVIARTLVGRWNAAWDRLLAARDSPLQPRLQQFYADYVGGIDRNAVRLFMRLNLDGHTLARRFAVPLTEKLLEPMVAALRAETGLPATETRAMMHGERNWRWRCMAD